MRAMCKPIHTCPHWRILDAIPTTTRATIGRLALERPTLAEELRLLSSRSGRDMSVIIDTAAGKARRRRIQYGYLSASGNQDAGVPAHPVRVRADEYRASPQSPRLERRG